MKPATLKRSFFQRILGIPATGLPADEGCWTYSNGRIEIDLGRAPELSATGGSLRLEEKNLPERVLVVRGDDDDYHAFRNRCRHMGRRLDPVPGTGTVQCCSISKSTYDYEGTVLSGPAGEALDVHRIETGNGTLLITLQGSREKG